MQQTRVQILLSVFINTLRSGGRLRFKVTGRFSFRVRVIKYDIYEKLSCISVCLGGAAVWSAGFCGGDQGSIPPLCVF